MFLQPQPCIRALKLARGLKKAPGEKVSITLGYLEETLTDLYGYGNEYFDDVVKINDENHEASIRVLAEEHDPHIVHSHNAPDFLTVSALNALESTPVIHDVHDSLTMRETGYYEDDDEAKIRGYAMDEETACTESDGRIYVSEPLREYMHQRYTLDPGQELVFHSYVSEDLIPGELDERLSSRDGEVHIAYAGTITSKVKGHHYDLREIFRELAKSRMHIHIYAAREDEGYRVLAGESRFIHYHGHLDQRVLLRELSKHDYGWAGFNEAKNKKHLDVVMPNKVFEYIACGLPVLTFSHRALSEFVEAHGVGLVIEGSDIRERLENPDTLQKNVIRKRYDYTVEQNISRLSGFYQDLLKQRV